MPKKGPQNDFFLLGVVPIITPNRVLLRMQDTPDFLGIPLDFQGFCVSSLVDLGLLIPGSPKLGVIQYKGRYCVFESVAAMQKFVSDPAHYFVGTREACCRNPELIQPLRLHEDFPKSALYAILQSQATTLRGTSFTEAGGKMTFQTAVSDDATQTPVHFLPETKIDPNYEWNEWKLRKDALRICDVRKKSTTSTQTVGSTFRSEKESQTYLPKTTGTSTIIDGRAQTITKKRYVAGLRGEKSSVMNIVDFQLEI